MEHSHLAGPAPLPPSAIRNDYRVPFGGMVRLTFGEMGDFVVACQGDISLGGMFLPTSEDLPVGTQISLELLVGDDLSLVRGRGEVVWASGSSSGKGPGVGVGIRFLELDPLGRELIFRTVDRYIQMGGLPFDLEGIEYRSRPRPANPWRIREAEPTRSTVAKWGAELLERYWGRTSRPAPSRA